VPAADLDPLAGLEILVVLEEVLDLLQRDVRQVVEIPHMVVAFRRPLRGDGNDFFILPGVVFHDEHADRPNIDDASGHELARIADEHVDRVAVLGQGVRHEAVVARVGHRRVQEPVDDQRTRFLVHFVLDGLAANRHLDDDVYVLGRVVADRYGVYSHARPLRSGFVGPGWRVLCRFRRKFAAPVYHGPVRTQATTHGGSTR
jgi:hypothetical protein